MGAENLPLEMRPRRQTSRSSCSRPVTRPARRPFMEAPLDHNQAPLVSLTVTTQQDLILIEARHPSRVYQGAHAQADGVSDPTTPPPRPGSRTEKPGEVFILCVHRRSHRRRFSPSPPSSWPLGLRGTRQRCGASGSPLTFTCSVLG